MPALPLESGPGGCWNAGRQLRTSMVSGGVSSFDVSNILLPGASAGAFRRDWAGWGLRRSLRPPRLVRSGVRVTQYLAIPLTNRGSSRIVVVRITTCRDHPAERMTVRQDRHVSRYGAPNFGLGNLANPVRWLTRLPQRSMPAARARRPHRCGTFLYGRWVYNRNWRSR